MRWEVHRDRFIRLACDLSRDAQRPALLFGALLLLWRERVEDLGLGHALPGSWVPVAVALVALHGQRSRLVQGLEAVRSEWSPRDRVVVLRHVFLRRRLLVLPSVVGARFRKSFQIPFSFEIKRRLTVP